MAAVSTNLLSVMQQLKDAQDRAKRAESRVRQLETENERLHHELRASQIERVSNAVGASSSNDALIAELQQQLAFVVNRNTQLELQINGTPKGNSQSSELRYSLKK